MFGSTKYKLGALLLGLTLVLTGCGGSSDRGGFSNPIDVVAVKIRTSDGDNQLDANLGLNDCGLDTSKTVIVELFDQEGQFLAVESLSVDVVPGTADGVLCTPFPPGEETDPEDILAGNPCAVRGLDGPFSRAVFENSTGIQSMEFLSFGQPGAVQLIASAPDPNSGQQVSAALDLDVVLNIPVAPAVTSMAFTGPFVNAVLAGENSLGLQDGEQILQDGTYQRLVSIVATDENGNPPACTGRLFDFFVIDGPLVGYPDQGSGRFAISGPDGNPEEGGVTFRTPTGTGGFTGAIINGPAVRPLNDRLILDGRQAQNPGGAPQPNNRIFTGIWRIEQVLNNDSLIIEQDLSNARRATPPFPFNPALADSGFTVPYLIGSALNSNILASGLAGFPGAPGAGVASTILTYPVYRLGQTAALMACTAFPQDLDEDGRITQGSADRKTCAVLNTCDADGSNCNAVFLPVTDGSDIVLTADPLQLGPNTTSPVTLCLKDRNFSPLPGTAVRFSIDGFLGSAKVYIRQTLEEIENLPDDEPVVFAGSFLTGADGCTTVFVNSSGQAPGSEPIPITFDADNSNPEAPVVVEIRGPGQGNLLATLDCGGAICIDRDPDNPNTGGVSGVPAGSNLSCTVDLLLLDDRGGIIPDIQVTHTADQQLSSITYDPAFGNFGLTDEEGAVAVSVSANTLAPPTITFTAGTATAAVSLALPDCPEAEPTPEPEPPPPPAPPEASLSGGNRTIEPGDSLSYTVLLSAPAASALTVGIASSGDTGEFTVPASVSIPAGASSGTFTVAASATAPDGASVQIQLSSGTGYTVGSAASATVTVAAAAPPAAPEVSLVGGTITLAQGGSGSFAVTLSEAQTSDLDIGFLVTGAAAQFTVSPSASPLTIPAGSSSADITVTAAGDAPDGAAITITLVGGTGYTVGTPASGTATVVVPEPPPEP